MACRSVLLIWCLLFCTVQSITYNCSGWNETSNCPDGVECPDDKSCHVICDSPNACANSVITCGESSPNCSVDCTSQLSCTNAIINATGVAINEIPFTPERVWQKIRESEI